MSEIEWKTRTHLLLGDEALEKLKNSHVLIVGLGGVGAYAAEQICRAGVGEMTIVDHDVISQSNINRQLVALNSTIGQPKAEILANRLLDINPELKLNIKREYLKDEKIPELLSHPFDYVVDAIDTLSPKTFFIYHARQNGLNLVSSMGAGGRMDPTKVQVDDFSKSHHCRLAFYLRKRLRKMGVSNGFKVVYSEEVADRNSFIESDEDQNKKSTVGTVSYMPAVYGCMAASVVIRGLTGRLEK